MKFLKTVETFNSINERLKKNLKETIEIDFSNKINSLKINFPNFVLTNDELKDIISDINEEGFYKIILNFDKFLNEPDYDNFLNKIILNIEMHMLIFRKEYKLIKKNDKVEIYIPKLYFNKFKMEKLINEFFDLFYNKIKNDISEKEKDFLILSKNNLIRLFNKINERKGIVQSIIVNLLDFYIRFKILENKIKLNNINYYSYYSYGDFINFIADSKSIDFLEENFMLIRDIIPTDCKNFLLDKSYVNFGDMCENTKLISKKACLEKNGCPECHECLKQEDYSINKLSKILILFLVLTVIIIMILLLS